MTEREKLVDSIAKALFDNSGQGFEWRLSLRKEQWRDDAKAALSCIEAAGWTIVPPDDGR